MADISTWSPTDESNTAAPPAGWPENQQPSSVNNCGRAMMGAIRRWYDTVTAQLASITTSLGNYVLKTGDTMTGPLSAPSYNLSGIQFAGSDGTTSHIYDGTGGPAIHLQAAASYYDADAHYFRNNAGGINTVSISSAGDLGAARDITSGRHIWSTSGTVTAIGLTATGQVNGAYVHSTGNVQADNAFTGGAVSVSGAVTGNYLHSTGNVQADGTFTGGAVSVSGTVAGNLITSSGDITAAQSVYGALQLYTKDFAGGINYALYSNGGSSYINFFPNYFLQWVGANGTLVYNLGASGPLWTMRSDSVCLNSISYVAGVGAYVNLSDRRGKKNITPSARGLNDLIKLTPIEFDRVSLVDLPREIGFVAQDVMAVLPEAVRVVGVTLPDGTGGLEDAEPTLGLADAAIVAVLVNAVKELNARLIAVEGGTTHV